ncbi:helix-turn-helix domain-containing protein [Kaustia mangrovi]|uniref:Helix-turn-helix domain-containing protein n=1 Tax=Kaustia mangrovi TaxID=2593653 RepID=A0A7S8HCV9_9HYPH|nr:helix-turn-helix transcriptional regulator [Kaustia mangrovi]QPC43995.1 helix-turn-helix domain-containing protein [Kaustia mangrovi]
MNKPTIITSPSGDRMAVIPLEEYERLQEALEDASDEAALDRALRRVRNGEDEVLPPDIARRLLDDDENKVKIWRQHRGLTASELAEKAEISQSYISQIETGVRAGTVDVMKRIAAVLGVGIDDLV